jgi:Ca2+-binding EF-hand superfamily protein
MKKAGITNEQLYRWMKMIDSSNDGIIDQDELRLALLTEEDLID